MPELHVATVPALHEPVAPFPPHPVHARPVVSVVPTAHTSAHEPAVVEHPDTALHAALQQPDAVHAVDPALHVHVVQEPPPLQWLAHVAG